MAWPVEYTDEFGAWWDTLVEDERIRITASIGLLERRGPNLGFPHSSGISRSRHSHMRELRVQVGGRPVRVFYAFDPRRIAILLIAGDRTGRDDFYARLIPLPDRLYDEHLAEIAAEAARREQDHGG
ncbi:MAG: type II toxin-antitoxin system RelE/ParE family toxin [Acetobacteraceae bacterium]